MNDTEAETLTQLLNAFADAHFDCGESAQDRIPVERFIPAVRAATETEATLRAFITSLAK